MMEVSDQRKVLTTSSHLSASLMILLTTWPDSTPGELVAGRSCQNRARASSCRPWGFRWVGGVTLQKEGSKSGAIGTKGLWEPGVTTRTHPGSRAEGLRRSLERRELWVLPGQGRSWERLCGPNCLGSEATSVSYESYDLEQFP